MYLSLPAVLCGNYIFICTHIYKCYISFNFPQKNEPKPVMTRSLSVPGNKKNGSVGRTDSFGGVIRIIPSTPRVAKVDNCTSDDTSATDIGII